MKTRFAPSPTGFLHVGNIRTAIIQYLYTKSQGGEFILRFDDTDIERGRDEYAAQILKDLEFLGLNWDGQIYRQIERLSLYEKAKNELIAKGKIYPCYETPQELEIMRKSMQARGVPPIYDRRALKLHPDQIKEFEEKGIKPHYRFLLEDKEVKWDDKVKGTIKYKERSFSDPVVFRENGMPMYVFASVVDDVDMGITDIIRGEDHVTNTAVQIQMFEALGHVPNFAHLTLVKSTAGKISKRIGGFSIKEFKEKGIEAMAIINLLGQLGTGKSELYMTLDEMKKNFDISLFSKAAPNYEHDDLMKENEKYLHNCPYSLIKPRLEELDLNIDENFWDVAKHNISLLSDIKEWIDICKKEITIDKNSFDLDLLKTAKELLPQKLTTETVTSWLNEIKEKTGKKGKELFMPIRLAITGNEHGPDLKHLVPLIGRKEIMKRLS